LRDSIDELARALSPDRRDADLTGLARAIDRVQAALGEPKTDPITSAIGVTRAESVSKNQPPSALRRPSGAEEGEAAHFGRSRAADVGEGLPPPPTKKLRA
jgi:hypothetical protein